MNIENTSNAYARALIEIGDEQKIDVAKEILSFNVLINESNDLENLINLEVFEIEEKESVVKEISERLNLSQLVKNFLLYLVREKRINLMQSIYKTIVVIDDERKGFLRGTIHGPQDEISEDVLNTMKEYIKEKTNKEPVLNYEKNEKITAGYRIKLDDHELDATIDNQLNKFKNEIIGN